MREPTARPAQCVPRRCAPVVALAGLVVLLVGGCGQDVSPVSRPDLEEPADVGRDVVDDTEVDDRGAPPPDSARDARDTRRADSFFRPRDLPDLGSSELRIDAVVPVRGPIEGGTPIVILGEGFTEDSVVLFDGRPAEFALVDASLVGVSPPGTGPGAVRVSVSEPTYGWVEAAEGFIYLAALRVDALTPDRVPVAGGVEVSVRGRGFDDDLRISFGGRTALRHTVVSSDLVRVLVPPNSAGTVDLRATNLERSVRWPSALTYFEQLSLDRVEPAVGRTAGGDGVTVFGAAFEPGTSFSFGGQPAAVVSATSVESQVLTPAGAGLVDVSARTPGGDAALLEDAFYYAADTAALELAAAAPDVGPAAGGTRVRLVGAGLHGPGLAVQFGGANATIVNSGWGFAVVETPPHPLGSVDVRVTDGAGRASVLAGAFEFVEDLWVDRVTPAAGNAAGGYDVILRGEGFTGATRVEFGSTAAAFTVVDDTTIRAQAPAHSPGVVDVLVSRGAVQARLFDAFSYTEDLDVLGFSPVRGSIAGGTYVELYGRGFVPPIEVEVDGSPAPWASVLDAQTLAFRTPPHGRGPATITVRQGARATDAAEPFSYFNPGDGLNITSGLPVNGAVNVTVFEPFGSPIEGAFVMLSTNAATPYTGYTDGNGLVTLSGPDVFGEQTVSATVKVVTEPTPCSPGSSWTASASVQRVDAENVTLLLDTRGPPTNRPIPPEDGCRRGTFECWCRTTGGSCRDDDDCAETSTCQEQRPGRKICVPVLCDSPYVCNQGGVCCPGQGAPVPTPGSTFTGRLRGLNKLAEPGPDEFAMAIVFTTQVDWRTPNPDPGMGNVVVTDGPYTIQTRIGDLALIAVGGLYDNSSQLFTPMMLGVERYLVGADGETQVVDIELDIELDKAVSFKLNDPSLGGPGPETKAVYPYLDFGIEGVWGSTEIVSGTQDDMTAFHQPALEGELADVRYWALGGLFSGASLPSIRDDGMGAFFIRGPGQPFSVGLLGDIVDVNETHELVGERQGFTDGSARVRSGTLARVPVDPHSAQFRFTAQTGDMVHVRDTGFGTLELLDATAIGVIDYTTGDYSFTPRGQTRPGGPIWADYRYADVRFTHQIPGLLGPPQVTSPTNPPLNNLFEFHTNSIVQPDIYWASVVVGPYTLWEVYLSGDEHSFRLPDFPPASQLPPELQPQPYPPAGPNMQWLLLFAIQRPGISLQNFQYFDLTPAGWTAFAVNYYPISLQ